MWSKKLRYEFILMFFLSVIFVLSGCASDKSNALSSAEAPAEKSQPAAMMGEISSVTAAVADIDYDTRHVTLKMPNGDMVPVAVGEEAYNFDQVKAGDLVDISYTKSVAIQLNKDSGGEAGVSTSSGIERVPKGQKPQGTIYNTMDIRAKVVGINYSTRTVELSGPDGNVFPVVVDKSVPNFENVKVGDVVSARYTEAVAISVRPAIPR